MISHTKERTSSPPHTMVLPASDTPMTAYIGIGSNQGDKYQNCMKAIEGIGKGAYNQLLAQSSCYLTEPWGFPAQDTFVNLVIKIKTVLSPWDLNTFLHALEETMGRTKAMKWGPRVIDLDILFYDHQRIATPQLTIPHPLLHLRGFVLIPLQEIDPELVHPVCNQTITQLATHLEGGNGIITRVKERT